MFAPEGGIDFILARIKIIHRVVEITALTYGNYYILILYEAHSVTRFVRNGVTLNPESVIGFFHDVHIGYRVSDFLIYNRVFGIHYIAENVP